MGLKVKQNKTILVKYMEKRNLYCGFFKVNKGIKLTNTRFNAFSDFAALKT